MITRIEIDGFKSFADFSIDLPPFLAVIGTNASGKSNLFDALRFLSAHVRGDVYDAVDAVRGDAVGLFRQLGDGSRTDRMTFGVELIVDPDRAWGRSVPPDWRQAFGTRWRYELQVTLGKNGLKSAESFVPMPRSEDRWTGLAEADPEWAAKYVSYIAEAGPQSELVDGLLGGEGRLRLSRAPEGPPRRSFETDAESSEDGQLHDAVVAAVYSSVADISAFQLEDLALRKLSSLPARPVLQPNGAGLPAYLDSLRQMSATEEDPAGILAEIRADLTRIVREVISFDVVEDEERRDVRIVFEGRYTPRFGAEVASDGTLRVLALLSVLNDPAKSGLLAIEEPENGVFPERLRELLTTMRGLVTDPVRDDPGWPLKQVLVTSHSPIVLDAVPRANIVYLENVTRIQQEVVSRITQARRLVEAGRPNRLPEEKISRVTESELDRFRAGREFTAS
ncbi:AAA family ATPase [Streptosporangium sp. KLBMP 9127]|nr:AAA family ATPase [Streptosporangium sp. KLBMP 9127]